jgi:hypothetical protein
MLIRRSYRTGAYARVFGVPRRYMEAVMFTIYFIRPVEDPHEVLFHFMEAMVATLQHSRRLSPVSTRIFVHCPIRPNTRVCHSQDFTIRGLRG